MKTEFSQFAGLLSETSRVSVQAVQSMVVPEFGPTFCKTTRLRGEIASQLPDR